MSTYGRCIQITPSLSRVEILTEQGPKTLDQITVISGAPGDIVEVKNQQMRRLTQNFLGTRSWADRILSPRRLHAMTVRRRVEKAIREYFESQSFIETRTPLLVPSPGMEIHIRPFRLEKGDAFLPTSPEFAMKRLLVGGLTQIFQISPAFRNEPQSTTHHPEFTMLEWYRAYAGFESIMSDVENLVVHLVGNLVGNLDAELAHSPPGKPEIKYQGQSIDLRRPWPRYKTRELFTEYAGIDLKAALEQGVSALQNHCKRLGLSYQSIDTWDDLYFRIWLNCIEVNLPAGRPVIVSHYPPSQAALAVLEKDTDGSTWAKRFEVYIGGLELGNAFEELTDPVEQRKRFVEDMKTRESIYGAEFPATPIDEGFLNALSEGMPPTSGIAMGVDRLVMLLADEADIDQTIWLPSSSTL